MTREMQVFREALRAVLETRTFLLEFQSGIGSEWYQANEELLEAQIGEMKKALVLALRRKIRG